MSKSAQITVQRRSFRGCLIRSLLLLLLLLIGGGAAGYFLVPPPAIPLPPFVQITSPQTGDMSELNTPLTVQASAEGPDSFQRLELYSDGALVAAEASTLASGSNPLILLQNYTPLTLGRHVLMVRGYIADDNFADSGVVYLDVIEPSTAPQTIDVDTIPISDGVLPSLIEIATASGVPPDQLQAANPALNGIDPSLPLPPGTTLVIPPGPIPPAPETDTVPPTGLDDSNRLAPLASAPAAPTALSLTLDCASAQLLWADNTSDETGFVVYRLAPGDTQLNRVATLPANTTTYGDSLPALGTYRYQVAATRGGIEGLSLMPSAVTPDTCVPPAAAFETVVLSVLSLETVEAYDGVYCYFDINGSGYQRAPAADFFYFTSEADGLTYNLARQLPNHGQFVLAVPPGEGAVTLGGECWGQHGPIASPVGLPFKASYVRSDWDGRDLIQTALNSQGKPGAALPSFSGGNTLRLIYRLSANTPSARRDAIAGQYDPREILTLDQVSPELLYGGGGGGGRGGSPTPEPGQPLHGPHDPHPPDVFNPPTNLRVENLPSGPTLFWDWQESHYVPEPDLFRYQVTLIIHLPDSSLYSPSLNIYRMGTDSIPRRWLLPTDELPCGSRVELTVQAFLTSTQANHLLASDYGGPILWMNTEPCPGSAKVTVRFNRLLIAADIAIGDAHDVNGDPCFLCVDRRLELAGFFGTTPGNTVLETSETGGTIFARCPTTAFCLDAFWSYQFADLNARLIDVALRQSQHDPTRSPRSDTLTFNVRPGQTVTIFYSLNELDYGTITSHVTGCVGRLELRPVAPSNWASINGTYEISSGPGSAEGVCLVSVSVTAEPLP